MVVPGPGRPPLGTWLAYRLLDRRIPVAYRAWARADIDGFWFRLRTWFLLMLPPYVALTALAVLFLSLRWFQVLPLLGYALMGLFFNSRHAARIKHVVPHKGEQPRDGDLIERNAPRTRLMASSALRYTVPLLVLVVATSVVTTLFAPHALHLVGPRPGHGSALVVVPAGGWARIGATVGLAVALAAGLLAAARARRRFDQPNTRVNQPHRVMRVASARGKVIVLVATAAVAALAWSELAGIVLEPGVVLGMVALLLLPGALVARTTTGRPDGAELTIADAWWIALTGLRPSIDRPISVLEPFSPPPPPAVADS
ncbi:hypothetical protein [Pengzhenrongella sp.]|uniref:hypothetical protein n=1 Tax=Pengzhenrongella sp. TaxID=2888820 RepID=UPI002F93FCC9